MVHSRIPRRASRNLTWWQRFKRWLSALWHCDTVIRFDEAPKKGVRITFDYSGSVEEQEESEKKNSYGVVCTACKAVYKQDVTGWRWHETLPHGKYDFCSHEQKKSVYLND